MIKKIISVLVIITVFIFIYRIISIPNEEIVFNNPDLIFYWGNGCPHCETVKKWLNENNQDNLIKINSKEVYKNKNNAQDLSNTVDKFCPKIKQNGSIGVPTAFDPINQKCLQGSDQIIEFLSNKLKK